jgi:thiamine kinase-like enzyme
MTVFNHEISNWDTWGKVYHHIEAFEPLIKRILKNEELPIELIEKLKPGTHAVFKVGKLIVKIFAPIESGYDSEKEYLTEIEGIHIAQKRQILTPIILRKGLIKDKYQFRYLIMENVEGNTLGDIKASLTSDQKKVIGKKIRDIVDRLNQPCESFHQINVIERTLNSPKWEGAPKEILDVQSDFLQQMSKTSKTFCHGDLTEDNIIITDLLDVYVLDFADAVCAPFIYEYAPLIVDAFSFDQNFLEGFFGEIAIQELISLTIHGLLIHEYGYQSIKAMFKNVKDINTLREKIFLTFVNYKSVINKN